VTLTDADAAAFERCMAAGGVAVFPADTVYGLACAAENAEALRRLYLLKGRRPDKPAAVMFFDLGVALDVIAELGPRTRKALEALLPGPLTALVPNPAGRFPAAGGEALGLRVPALGPPMDKVRCSVLQSSANLTGGADPRTLVEVPQPIRDAADLVLDGGPLPGTPSTVLDLTGYEHDGEWRVVREGAVSSAELVALLGPPDRVL